MNKMVRIAFWILTLTVAGSGIAGNTDAGSMLNLSPWFIQASKLYFFVFGIMLLIWFLHIVPWKRAPGIQR